MNAMQRSALTMALAIGPILLATMVLTGAASGKFWRAHTRAGQ